MPDRATLLAIALYNSCCCHEAMAEWAQAHVAAQRAVEAARAADLPPGDELRDRLEVLARDAAKRQEAQESAASP